MQTLGAHHRALFLACFPQSKLLVNRPLRVGEARGATFRRGPLMSELSQLCRGIARAVPLPKGNRSALGPSHNTEVDEDTSSSNGLSLSNASFVVTEV